MQANMSECVWRRAAFSAFSRLTGRALLTALAIAAMALVGTGCVQVDPCSDDPCDDDDLCTTDVCTVVSEDVASSGFTCTNTPVDCDDEFCNPVDGECVECLTNDQCDNGDFCDGPEVCANNTCVDGPDPCDAATEVCDEVNDECDLVCTSDADCPDDGLFCNGDESCDTANGVCVSAGDPCAGNAATPVCNETGDSCVECLTDAQCTAPDTCVANVCTPPVAACETDEDCDDGLFCTGVETCNTSSFQCETTGNPCAAGETCDEDTDACFTPGDAFTLTTEDDAITGTPGNDTFTAAVGTLNPGDIVVGNGGSDNLNAAVAGNTSSLATLIDIDFVNFQTLNPVTFDAANSAAIGQFAVVSGSTGNLTLDNLEADTALRMGSGYAKKLTATLADDAGASNEMDLTVDGTANGAAFDYVQDADDLETLNLIVVGSELSPADPGTDFFGDVGEVLVTGEGDLILSGFDDGTDLPANAIDTSDFEGELTLSPLADNGNVVLNFTAGGLAGIEGIDNYIIADTLTFNHTLTLNIGDSPFNIDISSIEEDDLAGNVTVTQTGTARNDTINLDLGGDGDGMGSFTAGSTEFLNIVSGGTTANEINDVTIAVNVAFTTTTVTVSGDQDLDLGTVVADGVDAAGFDGDLTVDNTGQAGSNQIVGGNGDDLLIPGDDIDEVTGGPGVDTFGFDTITANADGSFILDFVAGTGGDILRFDQATFTEYDGSDIVIVDAAGVTDTAGADNEVVVDTAANIAGIDTSGGNGSNPIAIATDTGDIYYDADGNYVNAVVIGNIDEDQVEDLVPANFDFP